MLCYATLHLFYDFMHLCTDPIYVCEQMNGQQDSAGHAVLHEIKLRQCKTHYV